MAENGYREGILIVAHEPDCSGLCRCDPTRHFLPMPEGVRFARVSSSYVDPYRTVALCSTLDLGMVD